MDHQLEMTDWDSNGHVTYDVTLPGKVKVMTPVYLGSIISTTVGDTDLVPIKHLLKMTTWESNGHVNDDVTWPWMVKVVTLRDPKGQDRPAYFVSICD